jgi:hypothetical protein
MQVGASIPGRALAGERPSITRLSKFVSHPFVLLTVTVVQVPIQPVAIVATCPGARVAAFAG